MRVISNLQLAWRELTAHKLQSFLTILGITFGLGIIVLAVNVANGFEQQIDQELGVNENLITVRSGRGVIRNAQGEIESYNFEQLGVSPILTAQDLDLINRLDTTVKTAPVINLSAQIRSITGQNFDGHIIASNQNLLELANQQLASGTNFDVEQGQTAIIGSGVASELFGNSQPIGHIIRLGQSEFIVRGVIEAKTQLSPLKIGLDYDRSVIIPSQTATTVNQSTNKIYEILIQVTSNEPDIVTNIKQRLAESHPAKDFSVFWHYELSYLTSQIVDIVTSSTWVIGLISLIVGGISITNIMFARVWSRTREIGVRKALGANNSNILGQFLTEALLLSFLGGLLGVLCGELGSLLVDYLTDIKPLFAFQTVWRALLGACLVGFIFGLGPALQAARQRPLDALRA